MKIQIDSLRMLNSEIFLQGMPFSPMTFTNSPAHSNMCGTGRTPLSTPSRARSDLGSARKLRLVNEQEELVRFLEKMKRSIH